jgi:hypothetical protein
LPTPITSPSRIQLVDTGVNLTSVGKFKTVPARKWTNELLEKLATWPRLSSLDGNTDAVTPAGVNMAEDADALVEPGMVLITGFGFGLAGCLERRFLAGFGASFIGWVAGFR